MRADRKERGKWKTKEKRIAMFSFLVSLTLLTQTKEKERIDAATSRVVVVAKR
jgi:hypothetical protein